MARSIWSGTISFGLVSIPVKMYTATESKELKFHFLDRRDMNPIGYDKINKETGKHVDAGDIIRGFEVQKGQFVELTEDDVDRLDIELTHAIDICDFVDLDEIDPLYFRKGYYLLPNTGAEKPYRLLVRALEETGKVGVAKVVIRNKQHLACLRVYEDLLLLETMYYADEVRQPDALDGDLKSLKPNVRAAEVEMAKSLVENLSEPFDPTKYDDTYRKELLDLIRAKAEGMPLPEPEEDGGGEVVDLMQALRESVERTKRSRTSRKSGGSSSKSKTSGSAKKKTSSAKRPARKAS
jgi:DNA end-binding protein Ku